MKNKKIDLKSNEFIIEVVNFMLREYDADYNYVIKNPVIKGIPWYQYFWDTEKSHQEFKDWLYNFIKTKVNYKPYKIESIVNEIDFAYGLTIKQ